MQLFSRRRSGTVVRLHRQPMGVGRVVRVALGMLALASFAVLAGACGLENDANTAAEAPLGALKATDVVLETNLQSVETPTDGMGSSVVQTAGPSTGPTVISLSSGTGRPTVLAGFNPDSSDCLGVVEITSPGVAVLGETQAATYDFWVTGTTSAACDAASFAAMTSVPAGWPSGDPTSSGFPLP
jgi:hypothetical protein